MNTLVPELLMNHGVLLTDRPISLTGSRQESGSSQGNVTNPAFLHAFYVFYPDSITFAIDFRVIESVIIGSSGTLPLQTLDRGVPLG